MLFNSAEKQAVKEFSKCHLSTLRRWQSVNKIQTALAAKQHKDEALERCQGMTDIFTAAIMLKCFKE